MCRPLAEWSDLDGVRSTRSQFSRRARAWARLLQGQRGEHRIPALNFGEGRDILRKWKPQKTNAASRADGVARPFRRPSGARECDHARHAGATSMSPTCTVLGSTPNAKRHTEAGKLTSTALLENKKKSPARRTPGPETLPETRRVGLWGGCWSRERRRASDGHLERGSCRHDRADEMGMGHETMETHARAMLSCSNETAPIPERCSGPELKNWLKVRLGMRPLEMTSNESEFETTVLEATVLETLRRRRRSYEHRPSDKPSDAPRASNASSQQRAHEVRPPCSTHPCSLPQPSARISRPHRARRRALRAEADAALRAEADAAARPPRKILRVKGLGDKLGYPRANFVQPLIFLHQP